MFIAARCCSCLLELTVRAAPKPKQPQRFGALAQPDVSRPLLPQLLTLRLLGSESRRRHFSVLRHFTVPHGRLQFVLLRGRGLRAQHMLALSCLPRLSHLTASMYTDDSHGDIEEVEEARWRTRQQLSRVAAGDADRDEHWPRAHKASWRASVDELPLGPH